MLRKWLRWLPLEISLITFSCTPSPVDAAGEYGAWHAGMGHGTSTVQGDYNRTIDTTMYSTGLEFDRESWMFIIDGRSADDNRHKDMRLIGGWGNRYIKIGTGFVGVQGSYPTSPGAVAGVYTAAIEEDTYVSATTVPLYLRLTPYRGTSLTWHLDGYVGLLTRGSIDIPIYTIIPGAIARVTSEPHNTGGTYGVNTTMLYQVADDIGIQIYWARQYGRMDPATVRVQSDILGLLAPITTPSLNLKNDVFMISLVILTQ